MSRRILTAEDVARMEPGARLVLDGDVLLTSAARDLAARRGVVLVEPGTAPDLVASSPIEGVETRPAPAAPRASGRTQRIIVTAVGVNRSGVLAELTAAIGELGGDILDLSQRITGGYFHALLVVEISRSGQPFAAFRDALLALSEPADYVVTVIDERVFQSMHRL